MWPNSVTHNSVTDNRRTIKIDKWVGHEKHCTRNTLKVKRSKVKVTRSCDVVAQTHRIYFVNVTRLWKFICILGNRGCRSEWRCLIFDRKLLNSRFCACAVKYAQHSLIVLSNRHNFSPFIRNRGRWTRWWGQFLDRKQNWCYFCACALKKSPNHREHVFWKKSYSPVTGNKDRRSERRGQIFIGSS